MTFKCCKELLPDKRTATFNGGQTSGDKAYDDLSA
jgi:hypothetical protein